MRIFRTLLIAAVNAIKEFLAFATDNGESQVGDSIKLNDGMATSNYDWSAYPSDTTTTGTYTQTGTIEKVKQIGNDFVYVTTEPEQDNKDVTINTGEIYYAYTNENDNTDTLYATDNPIIDGNLEWTQPTLSANGTLGGDSFAVSLTNEYSSTYAAWKAFDNNSSSCFWTSIIPADLIIYNPVPLSVTALHWEVYDYNRRPTDWEWYGSNDNETYTLISSGTNTSNDFTLNFTPSSAYKYHKFKVITAYNQLNAKQINLTAKEQRNPSTLYENTGTTEFMPTALDPQPTFTVHTEGIQNLINKGCTDLGNGIYQGSAGNIIQTDFVPDFANANTWEIATKYTYNTGNSYATILGYGYYSGTSFRDYSAPYIGTENTSTFRVFLPLGSQSWTINNFNTGVDKTGTTWIKLKFTGTQYIFSYKKQENDTYTDVLVTTSSTKTYCTSPIGFLNLPYNMTNYASLGTIDFKETSITIDGQITTFYKAKASVVIGNDLYERNSGADDVKPISGVTVDIETVDNTTINTVTVSTPTESYIDTPYYAYTNENDNTDTLYATDNPIKEIGFNLENLTNSGCTINNTGWATGGSNKKLVSTFIPNFGVANTWEFQCTFEYNGGGSSSYGQSILGLATGGGAQLPSLCTFSNGFRICLSSNGRNWNICDVSKKEYTLTTGQIYNIKFGFTGTEYYLDVKRDEETDFPAQHYWSLSSTTKVYNNTTVYMELMNYARLEGSMYFNGPINLIRTKLILDENIYNFGYFTSPSIIYENTGTTEFTPTAVNPQPTFTLQSGNIIISNNIYERNSDNDNFVREIIPATIETSTNITTSNNDNVITDGSYKLFNLTIPAGMTAIIESNGISYQVNEIPLLVKKNSGVGLLLKNGNNVYYRNSWVLNRDYDLHYQQINFSYPSGATIMCKVNNVVQSNLTPYVYKGDIVTWTCDNAGTVTTGSYTVKYSTKDGNVKTITIS